MGADVLMPVVHADPGTSAMYMQNAPDAERAVRAMMDAMPKADGTTVHADGVAVTTFIHERTTVETMIRPWSGDHGPTNVLVTRISTGEPVVHLRLQCEMDESDPKDLRGTLVDVGEAALGVLAFLALEESAQEEMERDLDLLTTALAHRALERRLCANTGNVLIRLPGPSSPLRMLVSEGSASYDLIDPIPDPPGIPLSMDVQMAGNRIRDTDIVMHISPRNLHMPRTVTDPMTLLRAASVIPKDWPTFLPDLPEILPR